MGTLNRLSLVAIPAEAMARSSHKTFEPTLGPGLAAPSFVRYRSMAPSRWYTLGGIGFGGAQTTSDSALFRPRSRRQARVHVATGLPNGVEVSESKRSFSPRKACRCPINGGAIVPAVQVGIVALSMKVYKKANPPGGVPKDSEVVAGDGISSSMPTYPSSRGGSLESDKTYQ